jgi:hypothetical protein
VTTLNERRGKHLLCLPPHSGLLAAINAAVAAKNGIDCNRTSYPNPDPKLTLNNPDKLCMQLTATSQGGNTYSFASAEVDAHFRFSIDRSDANISTFQTNGVINWKQDEDITLPDGHQGFQLDVVFADSGEKRSFFGPGAYGPLKVSYDPSSKTVGIRAIIK